MTPQDALATLPKKLKVGPHTYAVKVVEAVSHDANARAGINCETQTIEITNLHASSSAVVGSLIHELLHGIWDDRNLGKRADEEKMVMAYESGLVQLFQDNPKLLTWIKRGLRK